MKRFAIFLLLASVLVSCSQEPELVEVTRVVDVDPIVEEVTRIIEVAEVVEVTREVIQEIEVEVTREIEVTKIVEVPVTVTFTPTPLNTPTPSNTPTITPTPTNTATPTLTPTPTSTPNLALTATVEAYGELASPKGNGFHTVGTEILSGKWRSSGLGNDGCYWARLDSNQNILGNNFGSAGGTVNIRPTDFEVEFSGCGIWTYVEDEVEVLQDDASEPKESGFYTVGVEIVPGTWQSSGTGDGCYWARLDGNQNVISNHFGNAGGSVTISPNDYEVEFSDCGTWELQN